MTTELQVGTTNTQVAPVGRSVSLPSHDSPQIDLETGLEMRGDVVSKLDAEAIRDSQLSFKETRKYEPKKFWNADIKKEFNALSASQQKAWLDSFKVLEKSYEKTISGLKESFANLDDIADVLAPYVNEIVNNLGVSPATYVANLIDADKEASADPVQYILKIMGAKGVTFAQLGAGVKPLMDKTENEEKLAPVMNKISELEQKLTQQEQITQQPTQDDLEYQSDVMATEIKDFYNQTDSSGRELYPGWESMLEQILPMYLKGASLNDAYNTIAEEHKAKIPKNQTREVPTFDVRDDGDSRSISVAESRAKEKEMLKNIADQLSARY
jgi:hypothetical protein